MRANHRMGLGRMASTALLVALAWKPSVVCAELDPQSQAYLDDVQARLKAQQTVAEFQGLAAMDMDGVVAAFAAFKPHAHDPSRINHGETGGPPAPDEPGKLSRASRQLVFQALTGARYDPTVGAILKSELMGLMLRQQAWTALGMLEDNGDFGSAGYLAEAMLETEPIGSGRDTLYLVAARDIWLAYAGAPQPEYEKLIEAAASSGTGDIANQALVWKEALAAPESPRGLTLAQQIWLTVHLDLKQRERSGKFVMMIADSSRRIVEALEKNAPNGDLDQDLVCQLVSIAAGAAFQTQRLDLIRWALDQVKGLPTAANPDDKLAPQYFLAWYYYSRSQYAKAGAEFQTAFLSNTACDVAADSGYMIADCFMHMGEKVGAKAAVDLVIELYPNQSFVIPTAEALRAALTGAKGVQQASVDQYIQERFRPHLEHALAGATKLNHSPLAMAATK